MHLEKPLFFVSRLSSRSTAVGESHGGLEPNAGAGEATRPTPGGLRENLESKYHLGV